MCKQINFNLNIFAVNEPDFDARERYAKAAGIILEVARLFLFKMILRQKKTIEALIITLRSLNWKGKHETHIKKCLLKSGRDLTEDDFDTSMLYFILRNGQILDDSDKPTNGWGKKPGASDITRGDDVERIRLLCNRLFHNPFAAMTEKDFESFKKESKDIMHRWSNNTKKDFVRIIDTVVNVSLTADRINKIREQFIEECKRYPEEGDKNEEAMQLQTLVNQFIWVVAYALCSWYSVQLMRV